MPKTKNTKNVETKTRKKNTDAAAAGVKRLYSHSAPLLIAEAILLGIASIIMLIWPMQFLAVLTFVIGAGLILFGLYRAVIGFVASRSMGGGFIDVIFGLANIVLGVLFCAYPVTSIIGISYIFIVLFLFKAIKALIFSINMARARVGHYVFSIILSIILIGLAVLLLIFPAVAPITLVYYMAITLLLYAISDIYMYAELAKLKKFVDAE